MDNYLPNEEVKIRISSAQEMVKKAMKEQRQEIANKLIDIENSKWKDAEHCTCLGYAIVTIFGEEYEKFIKAK